MLTGDPLISLIVFSNLVDNSDVRMFDRRGRLCFLDEAAPPIAVVRQVVGQDLERDVTIEARVGGAIDHAHAAAADFFGNPIMAERAAGEIHALRRLTGAILTPTRVAVPRLPQVRRRASEAADGVGKLSGGVVVISHHPSTVRVHLV